MRINDPHRHGASFRRAEVPFKSARATHPSGPTGLADGLELESTPTRNGESAPRHLLRHSPQRMQWFPRYRARGAVFGYTPTTIVGRTQSLQEDQLFWRQTAETA